MQWCWFFTLSESAPGEMCMEPLKSEFQDNSAILLIMGYNFLGPYSTEERSFLDHPGPLPQWWQHPDRSWGEDLLPGGGHSSRGADVQLAEEWASASQLRADGHHPDWPGRLTGNNQLRHHRPQVHRFWHLHLYGLAQGRGHSRNQHRCQHFLHHWWVPVNPQPWVTQPPDPQTHFYFSSVFRM